MSKPTTPRKRAAKPAKDVPVRVVEAVGGTAVGNLNGIPRGRAIEMAMAEAGEAVRQAGATEDKDILAAKLEARDRVRAEYREHANAASAAASKGEE